MKDISLRLGLRFVYILILGFSSFCNISPMLTGAGMRRPRTARSSSWRNITRLDTPRQANYP